ncbi:MAG: Lrp/AsnC family transcriptional regulator [Chloroflexi bacterium]|nr:Lrp/AsnC family transcriptional regulator [Chloroflexota bacterium]
MAVQEAQLSFSPCSGQLNRQTSGQNVNIDPTDRKLIAELETSPREPYTEIAAKLGMGRSTVHARLKKLYDARVIKTVAVVDPVAVGNTMCVLIGINTLPGRMVAVAEQLSGSSQIQHLMLCMGRFDIIALALFRKRADFLDFLVGKIGSLNGVNHVESMLTLRHVKLIGPLLSDDGGPYSGQTGVASLDSLDTALIRELETDATQNTRDLARKLGTSQSTVLRKMQRLQDDRVIRIVTLTDPFALGYEGVASIGIRCDAAKVNEAALSIGSYRNVQTVAICAGRYDIIAWVFFREPGDLSDFVTSELSRIPGIQYTETVTNLKIVKASHTSVSDDTHL